MERRTIRCDLAQRTTLQTHSSPDSGSRGFASSTASSRCAGSSPACGWRSVAASLLVLPRPTIFMKDRRRLTESASLSEQPGSPLKTPSLREPRGSRYFPANLQEEEEEEEQEEESSSHSAFRDLTPSVS